MRIAYGIFGYGRGHATRAAAVLPEITRRHDVLLFAGGDAYDQLWESYRIVRIPTLGYAYQGAKRSNYRTIRKNAWHVLDILFHGPTAEMVRESMSDFRPDVVISDAEPWTHGAAHRLNVPRIGFDHFGILVHCRPPLPPGDLLRSWRDVFVYRTLMGRPQRVVVSSFYSAPTACREVAVIGPLLREEVRRLTPFVGAHLLAYFNNGDYQFTGKIEAVLRACGLPVRVYGTSRRGVDGNLDFRARSNVPFLEDLANALAVISTAGNQLVGEALHLRKPMLVTPEDCVEQRLNAAAVEKMQIGMRVSHRDFSVATIQKFLSNLERYRDNAARFSRDGRTEAIDVLERFLGELAPGRRGARVVFHEARI